MATIGLSLAAAVVGSHAEEESDQDGPRPEQPVKIADSIVYRWVFCQGSDAVAARKHLETLLQEKIRAVDLICELAGAQKQKRELAGRGDTNLDQLYLTNTQVTDAGLSHLTGLRMLQQLFLSETQVTESGVAKLQRARPRLTIKR